MKLHKMIPVGLMAVLTLDAIPVGLPAAAVTCAILAATAPNAVARPVRRAARTTHRVVRRTTRRVARRHMFGLPAGYRWMTIGAYRYAYVGGVYYYPYLMSGQTVYVEIDVENGKPTAPPSASQVKVEIDID